MRDARLDQTPAAESVDRPSAAGAADAQPGRRAPRPTDATVTSDPEPRVDERVEVNADRMEYDADRQVMIGIGNVTVRQHGDLLQADYLEVHTETREAVARGNVYFERDGRVWEGEEFSYNFRTREGDFGDFNAYQDPYYIQADDAQQRGPGQFELVDPRVTTCSPSERQEFYLAARSATITDGSVLRAKHVVARLYGIPIFYTPYLKKDFSNRSNIDVMPGYSSRMGAFLLTAYNFYPVEGVKASTQLDYRQQRGLGVGQRVRWRLPDNNAQGRFQAYYTDDDRPIRGSGQQAIREGLVDSDRYWLGAQHAQTLGPRNLLIADVNYLSDPFILEDFFDDEFRGNVQPENRVTLSHRDDRYTAALQLNMRLNDFYENVNRLPEASLDINRLELGESGVFYESEHSAAFLERVFPEQDETLEDVDSFRVDSSHTLLYPTRQFGFLSVIPRAGYRGTWYSQTPETTTTTNLVERTDADGNLVLDEDGNVLFDEEATATVAEGGAKYRSLFELGVDSTFKAFRVLNERPNYLGRGLRHIAEPYVRYTYVPEPDVVPGELYQFDAVDRLDKRHDVVLGMRNKLQTRRGGGRLRGEDGVERPRTYTRIHDFIDLDTFTVYRVDPEPDQEDFTDLFFDARVRPNDWMHIDFDGAYDWFESEVRLFNTQLALFADDRSSFSLEYRFNRDRRQTVASEVILFPEEQWSYRAFWRVDIDEDELEEQSYLIQRRFDCTMLGVGVRGRLDDDGDTEWRAWAQVSLLAFPDTELRLGR